MIPEAVNYEPEHRKIIMNSSLKKVREVNKKKNQEITNRNDNFELFN